jgi:phosphonatase-like hydrolase
MIELVVFDMAGTTVHDGDAVANSFGAALAAVDVRPAIRDINDVMGFHKPEAIRRLLSAAGKAADAEVVERIHRDFVERMLRFYKTDPAVREIPGASDVFQQLRGAGTKVALNTGFSREIVDAILRRLNWLHAIDASIASDEVPLGRPHPDMIRQLMARLHLSEPGRVAKVGDTPVDIEEGHNVGCGLIIGVTTGSFPREELERWNPSCVVGSIVEVPELLKR